MALLMNFTDSSGNEYTPAYWRAVQINIGAADQNINLVFYAYKDVNAFGAGRQPLPGGVKQYAISGAEFMGVAAATPTGATLYDVLAHASDSYAVGKLDTPKFDTDGNPVLGPDNNPVLISFFDSSIPA